ncbi:MAG: hypothetical protein EXR58_08230 [Chloroflexi bacterium]|nr:hypothetical protein [Chloroflexota bacterium]
MAQIGLAVPLVLYWRVFTHQRERGPNSPGEPSVAGQGFGGDMFTGIVEEVGRVESSDQGCLVVSADVVAADVKLGDSIAVNGVDLTVRDCDGSLLTFDGMPETFRRSNLANLVPDEAINLGSAPFGQLTGFRDTLFAGLSRLLV